MVSKKVSHESRAVVTGAGSGIGRAFALELAKRGGRVVVSDIDLKAAEETQALIQEQGAEALALKCDVSSLEEVEMLAKESEHWFGLAPSLVVNNAGVGVGSLAVGDCPIEDWRWIVGINLWGVIHGCHVFAPILRKQGFGGIINVSSAASFGSAPMMASYNTTKAGVLALSETLRAELASHGVKVSVLCPTFVKTNVIKNARMEAGSIKDAQKMMDRAGVSPNAVAIKTLDALDKNKIYVLPQTDAKISWFLKRLAPSSWTRLMSLAAKRMP
jgi:NAD(P)-dependent dehydrogenase (short-subunit alcohol dehydrogenase family)